MCAPLLVFGGLLAVLFDGSELHGTLVVVPLPLNHLQLPLQVPHVHLQQVHQQTAQSRTPPLHCLAHAALALTSSNCSGVSTGSARMRGASSANTECSGLLRPTSSSSSSSSSEGGAASAATSFVLRSALDSSTPASSSSSSSTTSASSPPASAADGVAVSSSSANNVAWNSAATVSSCFVC